MGSIIWSVSGAIASFLLVGVGWFVTNLLLFCCENPSIDDRRGTGVRNLPVASMLNAPKDQ